MTVALRKLTVDDAAALQTISITTYRETFDVHNSEENMTAYLKSAYNLDKLTRELQNPDSEFYFVYKDAQLAGYLKVNINDAQTETLGDDALEIERIYLKKEFHRNGLGRYLFDKSVELALYHHKQKIWLGVWEHNDNAIAFYERMGFVRQGAHSFFMGDDEQIDVIMVKPLES
ncbi:GNAT family N-acetyltransferase [Macrococcus lamae]|uniref:GNAT family N-acetyltransferase n=1 Tax=Macrococcus lamae TaxID=198484 RepID=A0A4R6BTJ8_9STAP|nr:GNAT family N-acetyltransferase [Macrococcus lamae]TDM07930.1 GNAT family N-acetyltransferase [Macrococcus lamae]